MLIKYNFICPVNIIFVVCLFDLHYDIRYTVYLYNRYYILCLTFSNSIHYAALEVAVVTEAKCGNDCA